jgi:glycosyltransferase involved in cell wall biosynthesis
MNKLNKKIVVCGAIRDCEKYLDGIFDNFKTIVEVFEDVKFIFVESDSTDNTLNKLQKLCSDNNFIADIISFGSIENKIRLRTQRIALARNEYLKITKEKYNDYDYILVLDMDDVNSKNKITKEAILSNFEFTDWDMITANQPSAYYDLWALRHETWMPYDCWRMATIDRPNFMSYEDAYKIFVGSRFIKINENEKLIKVKSSFGGMGFIKISSLANAQHIGYRDNWQICEWVPFCENLNNGEAKIFINPKFINCYDISEHVKD